MARGRLQASPRTLGGMEPALQRILAPLQPNLHFLLDDLAAMPEPQIRRRHMNVVVRLTLLLLQFVRSSRSRDPATFVRRWRNLMLAIWLDPTGRPTLLALFSYLASQLEAPRELGSADPDTLDRWADRIFTASSIDELLA